MRCFEDVSGADLTQFRLWYSQAGTPELVCALRYDTTNKTAELDIEQVLPATPGQPHKKPLHMPVKLGLLSGNGDELELKLENGDAVPDGILPLSKRKQTFRFVDVPSRPVPSLLREFSAPVNVTIDLADRDVEFLMANDGDLFNRWQAANSFATRIARRHGRRTRKGQKHGARRTLRQGAWRRHPERRSRARLSRRVAEAPERKQTSPASSARTSTRGSSTGRIARCRD